MTRSAFDRAYNHFIRSIREGSAPNAAILQAPHIFSPSLCWVRYVVTSALLLVVALVVASSSARDEAHTLRPFSSDGCSMAPDFDFHHCCVAHDYLYWQGGTEQARLAADRQFRRCIGEKKPGLSHLYYAAVRVGGPPHLPTPFRWGFGWTSTRTYHPLQPEEINQVKALTLKFINERHTACCNGDHESCVHLAALESVIGGKDENGDFDSLQSN